MKHKTFTERGQALILITLAAIGLFAFTGLAIDGSAKFSDQRHAQNAADTAAVAAALAKVNALVAANLTKDTSACPPVSGTPTAICAALLNAGRDRALGNGYANNLTSNTVEIYSPPISGYYQGQDKYVQVIITSFVNTYFARVIGINQTRNIVQAVAFAEPGGKLFNGASVVSLNPNPNCGNGSVNVGGNGTINLTGGGIFVNSNASCGYSQTSCSVILNIASGGISSAGSPIDIHGCSGSGLTTDTTQTQVVIPDEVYMPPEPIECSQTPQPPDLLGVVGGVQEWLIHPGYYTDFPQGGLVPQNKNIYLESGVYCVNSNIGWSGSTFRQLYGTSGNGVTIYIKSGNDLSININSPIHLNATSTSTSKYKGYLFIMAGNRNNIRSCTINGGSYLVMNGTFFAPYCDIRINGDNSSQSLYNMQMIGWNITLNGGNTINFNYDPGNNAKINRKVGLTR